MMSGLLFANWAWLQADLTAVSRKTVLIEAKP
jgi:hypothetical protein